MGGSIVEYLEGKFILQFPGVASISTCPVHEIFSLENCNATMSSI